MAAPAAPAETPLARDPRLVLLDQPDLSHAALIFGEDEGARLAHGDWRELRVGAVLQFLGGADDLQDRFACRVLAMAGDYFAVQVPLAHLAGAWPGPGRRLIDEPALLAVAIDRPQPAVAPAATPEAADAPALVAPRESLGLKPAGEPTGRGVLLCVVDTVIDHTHPAFLDADGRCRLEWLWDVNGPAGADATVPSGRLYGGDELRLPGTKVEQWELHAEPASEEGWDRIWVSHGTIVASIAAGHAPAGDFVGIAHGARLAFAGAGNATTSRIGNATDLLTALHFVLGQPGPVVANLSTADTLGPHDGSLLGERMLDEALLRPGRAAIVCAGNFGRAVRAGSRFGGFRHDHAVEIARDGQAEFVLRYDSEPLAADTAELWFDAMGSPRADILASLDDAGDLPMQVLADAPPVTVALPPRAGRSACGHVIGVLSEDHGRAGRWCLSLFFMPAPREHGDRQGYFSSSTWRVRVVGATGPVHAWVDRNNLNAGGWWAPLARLDWLGHTVGSPAGARRVIAVGAVDSADGLLASGSGRGAGLDGAAKPDLVARGAAIRAATPRPEERWGDAGEGTSLATPLVAGTAALLLESWGDHAPHATWHDIRQALLRGARLPNGGSGRDAGGRDAGGRDAGCWDPGYGWGVLDSSRALAPEKRLADVWLARTIGDDGLEPLVREFPWDSPAIVVTDRPSGGCSVAVTVGNRGTAVVGPIRVALFWGAAGSAGSPRDWRDTGWRVEGIAIPNLEVALLEVGAQAVVQFELAARERALAGALCVTLDCAADPLPDAATPTACNNVAVRSLPAVVPSREPGIVLHGTRQTDGLWLRRLDGAGRLVLRDVPITALPWRAAEVYRDHGRRHRPQFADAAPDGAPHGAADGAPDGAADPALAVAATLTDAATVRLRTDIEGAAALRVRDGLVDVEAVDDTLWLPRLRLAPEALLKLRLGILDPTSPTATVGVSVFSDGRRIGGAFVTVAAGAGQI